MMKIELSGYRGFGKFLLVSDEDFERVSMYKWRLNSGGYVIRNAGCERLRVNKQRSKTINVHRFITNCPDNMVVDHIDHDPLNNTRENLRVCTRVQNSFNRKISRKSTSGFKGVSLDKKSGKWTACIRKDKRTVHIGRFDDIILAAKAYNNAAIETHGEFAWLNPV